MKDGIHGIKQVNKQADLNTTMGWDIVAIGTNHNLPIADPTATAKRLLPLCPGSISIGYYSDWEYSDEENLIRRKFLGWKELSQLHGENDGETVKFEIHNACVLNIYEILGKRIDKVNFLSEEDKTLFTLDLKERYALYELINDLNYRPYNRIFNQIVDFSVNFPGRWFQFEHLFKNPYEGITKEILDNFRISIHKQMKLCGCDKAYLFPDQGYGDLLYDKINIPADEWLDYLMSGRHLAESKSNGDKLQIFNISEYMTGRKILNERENIHCIIDDFSDLK